MKARVEFLSLAVNGAQVDADFAVDGKDAETCLHEAVTKLAHVLDAMPLRGCTIVVEFDGYASGRDASSSEPSTQDAAGSPAASASSGTARS